jgi:hypothetical protein
LQSSVDGRSQFVLEVQSFFVVNKNVLFLRFRRTIGAGSVRLVVFGKELGSSVDIFEKTSAVDLCETIFVVSLNIRSYVIIVDLPERVVAATSSIGEVYSPSFDWEGIDNIHIVRLLCRQLL